MLDKRRRWKIIRNEDGTFAWRSARALGPEIRSAVSFSTLDDCIADAKRYGYVVRTSKERRTATPVS
jgi:hypothetical protein